MNKELNKYLQEEVKKDLSLYKSISVVVVKACDKLTIIDQEIELETINNDEREKEKTIGFITSIKLKNGYFKKEYTTIKKAKEIVLNCTNKKTISSAKLEEIAPKYLIMMLIAKWGI